MIILTGATGQLGKAIVECLIERLPVDQIGVSVRDPDKARPLADRGVRVRRGDFANPESLAHAFEGAKQVLMVSSNAAAYGGDPIAQHRSAIAAARSTGARRIVYTSQIASSTTSTFPPAVDHAATEEMLGQSGLAWTALRNGFYASSVPFLLGDASKTGLLEAPADGKVSWTTHSDLAEAAAIILTKEGLYEGATPPLTGSQALDLADLAGIASQLAGRPILRTTLTDEEMRLRLVARGMPEKAMRTMLGLYLASRNGEFSAVDPTLERLLGRPPKSVRDFLAAELKS